MDKHDRQRYEAMINDLRGQNERLSLMLKKKPVHSVIQNHVIGLDFYKTNNRSTIYSRKSKKNSDFRIFDSRFKK